MILDGFDEMKQSMSRDVMRYNFSQLSRLVQSQAKVVLSGRPNAFLTEDEHEELLHGKRQVKGEWRSIPDAPNYTELRLRGFTATEMKAFVTAYLQVQGSSEKEKLTRSAGTRISGALETPQHNHIVQLAERPVQLKMILDVLPEWKGGRLDKLTLTTLYSEFIDLIIRRESAKSTRQRFSIKQRREFARDLAWWMWKQGGQRSIDSASVPDEVFLPFCRDEQEDRDAVRRDLVAACFLEAKVPRGLYFPHRSFQEFLVAEKLLALVVEGVLTGREGVEVNDEVRSFFRGMLNAPLLGSFRDCLWEIVGVVPDWLVDLFLYCASDLCAITDALEKRPRATGFICLAAGLNAGIWPLSNSDAWGVIRRFLLTVPVGVPHRNRWAKLFLLLSTYTVRYAVTDHQKEAFLQGFRKTAKLAGDLEWLEEHSRVTTAELFRRHLDRVFCCLESWLVGTVPSHSRNVYISRRKAADVPDKPRQHDKRKRVHRARGVMPKKKW